MDGSAIVTIPALKDHINTPKAIMNVIIPLLALCGVTLFVMELFPFDNCVLIVNQFTFSIMSS